MLKFTSKLTLLALSVSLTACMGPVALERALPDYDETVNQLQSQALLTNIARARHYRPPHFTDTTSVVATFNFTAAATAGAEFSDNPSNLNATVGLGMTVEENPTIELTPLRGDQFAQKLLTPLTDDQFRMLATEELPLDLLIRLMGKAFHFQDENGAFVRTVRNRPDIPEEYEEFRRLAVHIAYLDNREWLYARRLSFVHIDEMEFATPPTPTEVLNARTAGFEFKSLGDKRYSLSQQVLGNTVVTNFDTTRLSDKELVELNDRIALTPSSFVDITIESEFPGGSYPLKGAVQLRSINEILDFVARGIQDAPEYAVTPDSRSEQLADANQGFGIDKVNPDKVLTIIESFEAPEKGVMQIAYRGFYYSVQQEPWDLTAFKSIYLMMQMSGQSSSERAFPITISK